MPFAGDLRVIRQFSVYEMSIGVGRGGNDINVETYIVCGETTLQRAPGRIAIPRPVDIPRLAGQSSDAHSCSRRAAVIPQSYARSPRRRGPCIRHARSDSVSEVERLPRLGDVKTVHVVAHLVVIGTPRYRLPEELRSISFRSRKILAKQRSSLSTVDRATKVSARSNGLGMGTAWSAQALG